LVIGFLAAVLGADWALGSRTPRERVAPDARGEVRIDVSSLGNSEVRFFRFLNPANQEILFLVGRDRHGEVLTAFDAAETHFKRRRGFRHQGDWLVDNVCDMAVRLEEVNASTGGCRPIPFRHRLDGQTLVLTEADLLSGWRLFN
jgi:uncharacterized membrane protein